MRFLTAAMGFKSESELKASLEWIREDHRKDITYIDSYGVVREDSVYAVGIFDYYTILGHTLLEKILVPEEDLPKEEILEREFSLSNYFYDSPIKGWENSFSIKMCEYAVKKGHSTFPYDADDIPGAVKYKDGYRKVVFVPIPIIVTEFTKEMSVWERLIPFYRTYNEYRMLNETDKSQDVYIISMHC